MSLCGCLSHLSRPGADPREGTIDEESPLATPTTPYDLMKREAEDVVWSFHSEAGLPVVVLRPPLIFGPGGRRWTVAILREILSGATMIDGGRGKANFLHVDNLVDAILASIGDGLSIQDKDFNVVFTNDFSCSIKTL